MTLELVSAIADGLFLISRPFLNICTSEPESCISRAQLPRRYSKSIKQRRSGSCGEGADKPRCKDGPIDKAAGGVGISSATEL